MNSCADSCCTYCRRDSSASATLVGWLIAAAAPYSHSAFDCLPNRAGFQPKPSLNKKLARLHRRFGLVHAAVGQWSSSNGSAPLSFAYGLHRFPCNNRDTIFLITTSAPLSTSSPHVCPRRLPHAFNSAKSPVTKTGSDDDGQSIPRLSSFIPPHHHSKPIASAFQKRLPSSRCIKNTPATDIPSSPSALPPECFRYSTKTYHS
jgi:hypothetical protein